MSEFDEAKPLIEAAKRDLNALLGMLQVEKLFSDEIFGLHVQQAVEKLTKAWLVILGETYPRIHNLDALFRLLEKARCYGLCGADRVHSSQRRNPPLVSHN